MLIASHTKLQGDWILELTMILPLTPVIQWAFCCLVLIQIVQNMFWVVVKGSQPAGSQ